MVVDSSSLVSVLFDEDDAGSMATKLTESVNSSISAANYVETCIVMAGRSGPEGCHRVDKLLAELSVRVVTVTTEDALLAREAFLLYGKGRHPAKLNFGDCFSYALAKRLGEPLLFKGNDFSQTDILQA
jgi:ribonuclease VapC